MNRSELQNWKSQKSMRLSCLQSLSKMLSLLLLLAHNTANGQTTYSEFQQFFANRLGSLERCEGLFRISLNVSPVFEHRYCNYNTYKTENFDIVAIYKTGNIVNVYSLNKKQIVGSIAVTRKDMYFLYVKFNGNGTKDYPGFSGASGTQVICDGLENNSKFNLSLETINIQQKSIHDVFNYEIASRINMNCSYYDESVVVASMFTIEQHAHRIYPDENSNIDAQTVKKGSGVLISSNGYILSNFHVVEKAPKLVWSNCNWQFKKPVNVFGITAAEPERYFNYNLLRVSDEIFCVSANKQYKLGIVDLNPDEDWALLKILDSSYRTTNFAVLDTQASELGTEVYTLGFPMAGLYGNDVKYTNGYISTSNFNLDYGLNMGVNPGNSGGGVFNKQNGHLIGVVKSRFNSNATGYDVEGISIALRLNNFARKTKNKSYFNVFIKEEYMHRAYSIRRPGLLIVDNKFNPVISQARNIAATVQIIVH
jgi:S1-C subfamily serine protease